ncbi:endo-arabinase [Xylariaceae sp. FL1651]|nr:endo-arabinase [Xylariaceae sp. FL1651]
MKFFSSLAAVTQLYLLACQRTASASSIHATDHGAPEQPPKLWINFPDPSLFQDDDGTWYAFAGSGNGKQVQAAKSQSMGGPWRQLNIEVLLEAPAWASGKQARAPDVRRLPDGRYIMYYAAELNHQRKKPRGTIYCVGAAHAEHPLGPYIPWKHAIHCDPDLGGSIDASGFVDPADGRHYVLYKIDGNKQGPGGPCGNGFPGREVGKDTKPTPLMIQEVDPADGVTKVGEGAIQLLDRVPRIDGPLVESPSLVRTSEGTYVLFFSSGCSDDSSYQIRYATAPGVLGPYERVEKPLASSKTTGFIGPGGATVINLGNTSDLAVSFGAECPGGRCFWVYKLKVDGNTISLVRPQ